jgi:hypothetical protein
LGSWQNIIVIVLSSPMIRVSSNIASKYIA